MRIVLVEDHRDTLGVLERFFTRSGHLVQRAACVADAVDVYHAKRFDLLVCDLALSDGDGWEVTNRKREFTRAATVKYSGFGMAADVEQRRKTGFCLHLTKSAASRSRWPRTSPPASCGTPHT